MGSFNEFITKFVEKCNWREFKVDFRKSGKRNNEQWLGDFFKRSMLQHCDKKNEQNLWKCRLNYMIIFKKSYEFLSTLYLMFYVPNTFLLLFSNKSFQVHQ